MSKVVRLRTSALAHLSTQSTSFLNVEESHLANDFPPVASARAIDHWEMIDRFNHGPVLLLDRNRRIVKANQAFCDLMGYTAEELEGWSFSQICALPAHLFEALAFSYQKGVLNKHVVAPFFTRSATIVHGKIRISRLTVPNQEVDAFQISVCDVSDFVKTNNGLRKQVADVRRESLTENMIGGGQQSNLKKIKDQMAHLLENRLPSTIDQEIRQILAALDTELRAVRTKQTFLQHFEKTCPSFSNQLLKYCPALTTLELKHCAYILMQLSPFEVAQILGINQKSVEMARYRIKKKLKLEKKQRLRLFLVDLSRREERIGYKDLRLSL